MVAISVQKIELLRLRSPEVVCSQSGQPAKGLACCIDVEPFLHLCLGVLSLGVVPARLHQQ